MEIENIPKGSELADEIKKVWAVAWPLIVTNVLNIAVGIVDLKMVGKLGVEAIAAVGTAGSVLDFVMVLMIAISGGSSILIAHAYGAKDHKRVSEISARSIVFMLALCAVIVTPVGLLFSKDILSGLRGGEDVVRMGKSYLDISFLGSVFTMFNFAVTGVLLGIGGTKISLVLLIGVNLLNVMFNFIFIYGAGPIPAMGVAGAALGTVAARALGSVAGIWITLTPRLPLQINYRDGLKFDAQLLYKILYLGGPRSLQGIVRNFSRLMTLWIIGELADSTRAVSAYSVGTKVRMISSFVGLAFMSAASTRVGQNMGGRNSELARKSGWISALMAAGFMSVFAALFLFIPDRIMLFFTDDRDVIAMGRSFFIIVALGEPIMAFAFALGGALRGGGDSMSPFIYGSVSDLFVAIVIGYIIAVPLQMGFTGIAVGIALSSFTRAIPTMIKYHKGDWKSFEV